MYFSPVDRVGLLVVLVSPRDVSVARLGLENGETASCDSGSSLGRG